MTITTFRSRFFFNLLIAKFLVIGWLFFMWATYGYSFDQLKEIFYIIAPIFAAHLIPAISFYAKRRQNNLDSDSTNTASKTLVITTWVLLIGYICYMVAILSFVPGQKDAFNNLKEMLGWAEILFGVFIGIIISELFSN